MDPRNFTLQPTLQEYLAAIQYGIFSYLKIYHKSI